MMDYKDDSEARFEAELDNYFTERGDHCVDDCECGRCIECLMLSWND